MTCKSRLHQLEQKLRDAPGIGIPHTECSVCMDAPVDTVVLPCGHICLCSACCASLSRTANANAVPLKCPLCRINADRTQRIYLPVHQPPPTRVPSDILAHSPLVTGASRMTLSSQPRRGLLAPVSANARVSPSRATPAVRHAWPPPQFLLSPRPTPVDSLLSKTLPASFAPRYDDVVAVGNAS